MTEISIGLSRVFPPFPGQAIDPESGLTLHNTFAVNSIDIPSVQTAPAVGEIQFNDQAVFAIDFTGLDGSGGGRAVDVGGSQSGAYIGFRANGDFIARCGAGNVPPGVNIVEVIIPPAAAHFPTGDGTLVVEFAINVPVRRARVWWNGHLAGSNAGPQPNPRWAGPNAGSFLTTLPGGLAQPDGEVTTPLMQAVHYTTVSGMRYYVGQLVGA